MEDQIYALFTAPDVVLRPRDIVNKLGIDKRVVNQHLNSLMKQKKLSLTHTSNGGNPRYTQGDGSTFIDSDDVYESLKNDILDLFITPETVLKPAEIARQLNLTTSELNRYLHKLVNERKLSVIRTSNGGNPRYHLGNGQVVIESSKEVIEKTPETDILNLFTTPETILKPVDIAKKLNLEKKDVNRYLHMLFTQMKLSVIRKPNGGDPRYHLGKGETIVDG